MFCYVVQISDEEQTADYIIINIIFVEKKKNGVDILNKLISFMHFVLIIKMYFKFKYETVLSLDL